MVISCTCTVLATGEATPTSLLSLLAVSFEPKEAPSGHVTLYFSGDASIQLEVECIEAELRDLGPQWRTRSKPQHPSDEPGAGREPGAGAGKS